MGGDTNHKKPTASVCSLVKWVGDTNHKKPTASVCSLVKWVIVIQIIRNLQRLCVL